MSNYNSCDTDDDLTLMHIILINIGITCGISLQNWQQNINIVIEKEEGNSKLHRLCIILLLHYQTITEKPGASFLLVVVHIVKR